MNILHITSSVRGNDSESSRVTKQIVDKLLAANPGAAVTRRDVGANPHPQLDGAAVGALFTPADKRTAEQAARVALDDALIAEAQAADVIVIGAPMYNFSMPEQNEGLMEGFQLWLNLPARDKMTDPWYRDIPAEEVPRFTLEGGVTVQVIAGSTHGVDGAVQREATQPLYLDLAIPAGVTVEQPIPAGHNAFVYVFRGEAVIEGKAVASGRMAILDNAPGADGVRIKATEPTRLLVLAGRPLNEPIAQYGPFVMNTQEELYQAVEDFRNGRFV